MTDRTVALIESDAALRVKLVYAMEKARYQVLTARDSSSGLQLCRDQQPEAVVLSDHLPGVDVPQYCHQLRALRDVPIALLADECPDEALATLAEAGVKVIFPRTADANDVVVDLYWLFENNWQVSSGRLPLRAGRSTAPQSPPRTPTASSEHRPDELRKEIEIALTLLERIHVAIQRLELAVTAAQALTGEPLPSPATGKSRRHPATTRSGSQDTTENQQHPEEKGLPMPGLDNLAREAEIDEMNSGRLK